ncbi:MAG: Gfo/Idh/MocA family oxidoreductase, partial [Armatimonadota bacterium]|nr:Gfo/Idh/MocA family oxidoreductase [Armatimonadota bacterium]
MPHLDRRAFLKGSLAAAGSMAGYSLIGTTALGANDRIRVAVAGLNGRGKAHIEGYLALPQVEIAYLVDPDRNTWAKAAALVTQKGLPQPTCVTDIRRALEDKDLDAVSIATPNHWHSLMTIWACQAGKHVYVEKPCSHDVFEGRAAVAASRKYNVIVQHGTQQRSSASRAGLIAAIHAGKFGKLLVSHGYCCKPRASIGTRPVEPPPPNLDWDLWRGPADITDFHRNLVHYNWHWFWPTGNGDIGNQGVHEMDVARWAIPGATLPRRVMS